MVTRTDAIYWESSVRIKIVSLEFFSRNKLQVTQTGAKNEKQIFFFIISHTWRKQVKFSSMITDASYSTFMWISGKELTTHAYIYSSFRLAYK